MDGNSLSEKFNNQLYTISSGNWTEVKSVFSPAIFSTTEVNFAEISFILIQCLNFLKYHTYLQMKKPRYKTILHFLNKKKSILMNLNIETFRGVGEIVKYLF